MNNPQKVYTFKGRKFSIEEIGDEYEVVDGFRMIDHRGFHHYDVVRDFDFVMQKTYLVSDPHNEVVGYIDEAQDGYVARAKMNEMTECDSLYEAAAYLIINQ